MTWLHNQLGIYNIQIMLYSNSALLNAIHVHVLHRVVLTAVLQETQGLAINILLYCAISNDIFTHADFQVDGYHGC